MSEETPKIYRIVNWNETYETSESRKLKRLLWVAIPNKHDGLGFRRMAADRTRCELFAAWVLMIQIASKGVSEQRGYIMRDGRPIDAEDMALITGFPADVFKRALEFFSNPKIGWLILETPAAKPATPAGDGPRPVVPPDCPAPSASVPGSFPDASGKSPATGREDITGREGGPAGAPPQLQVEETDEQWIERLQTSHPGVDVRKETEKALKKRNGEPFDRPWFEKSWLKNCSAQFGKGRKRAASAKEPKGWRVWWSVKHPGIGQPDSFDALPAEEQSSAWMELAGKDGRAA